MISRWEKWLAAERAAQRGGVVLSDGIVRDVPFNLVLPIPFDVSGDDFKASLANAPDAASPLVDMAVDVGTFADGITEVTCSLTKAQVNNLPEDGNFDGLEEVLFDLLHTPAGGTQERILALSIPISGKVTPGD